MSLSFSSSSSSSFLLLFFVCRHVVKTPRRLFLFLFPTLSIIGHNPVGRLLSSPAPSRFFITTATTTTTTTTTIAMTLPPTSPPSRCHPTQSATPLYGVISSDSTAPADPGSGATGYRCRDEPPAARRSTDGEGEETGGGGVGGCRRN